MSPKTAGWSELQLAEVPAVELLQTLGYGCVEAEDLEAERSSFREPILTNRLATALKHLNPWLSGTNLTRAVKAVTQVPAASLAEANETLYTSLTYGIALEQDRGDGRKSHTVRYLDFDKPNRNEWIVTRQYKVLGPRSMSSPTSWYSSTASRSRSSSARAPPSATPGRPKRSSNSIATRRRAPAGRIRAHRSCSRRRRSSSPPAASVPSTAPSAPRNGSSSNGRSQTRGIEERDTELRDLDSRLHHMAKRLADLDDSLAEAEQAHARARNAKDALEAFSEAGVETLHQASRERQRWTEARRSAETIRHDIRRVALAVRSLDVPGSEPGTVGSPVLESEAADETDLERRWKRLDEQIGLVEQELDGWLDDAAGIVAALERNQDGLRVAVERALAERGLDAGKLREIQELNRQASLLPSYEANLDQTRKRLHDAEEQFARTRNERRTLVVEQRKAFDRVLAEVEREFGKRIRARRTDDGDFRPLERFLRSLRQKGITRWWNDLSEHRKPSPDELIEGLGPDTSHRSWEKWVLDTLLDDPLGDMGMSEAVQATFRESITRARRRELEALRSPDRYLLELRMDDGSYRRLDELSGGQRVSVLLSLLLETEDTRPLVVDQPEDELDNRFLFETVLPALKKLKGRRQVIVATHDANIVVNGDADMVIQLEATANRGRVACSGAIEKLAIRDAIVRTVDGGEDAFRLRRRKYGF